MTKTETEALIKYLTFSVETMCDDMSQYVPNEVVGIMYDRAYGIVEDLERTLDTQVEMTPKIKNQKS